jgi:NADPH-dependent curcumin reductase CurA
VSSNRLIVLAARPAGIPTAEHFRLVDEPVPQAGPGQAVVRNALMSVDPSMRPRMNDVPSYVAPFQIDRPLEGRALGEVVESRNPALPAGATVMHRFGWRDYALIDDGTVLDTTVAPASAYLGVLGNSGMTAYAGVVRVARLKAGETIYISAAAGAVGSAAGQIAKLLGATTIGSSGSEQNVRYLLDELHYDRAFQARDGQIAAELQRVAPEGIDVYFDNVGGETLDAALRALRPKGRIAACGTISSYNGEIPGAKNLFMMVSKRMRMEGFLVSEHFDVLPELIERIAPALRAGSFRAPETYFEGLERAAAALISLFDRTPKHGKVLVRLP